ncbi:TRAP-type C4-dicarboxylate transport system, substrate-binding protein [Paracoccus solventivorans]|uniref:TRAP-type C4-dicarboxylate transport system, substrate-binding protein n=1 Tax=Paracoccus solventivorans TaxID=53463 RepID=A0A1M7ES21_9RHOB|nr:TRAP transporter substrate-binding protein DctP [Paracoccus solventivorans]SHL94510.1 TRAP-type C4-dicarboxylate transport system, substrate-binding protein [Paracoccus solventivorans]
MTYPLNTPLAAAALCALAALGSGPAAAETLRVADSFPVGHYIAENMTKAWMDKVTELTDGEITFDYYPAEQMGKSKDLMSLAQTGVVDIGYAGVSYLADTLPLSAVGELPEAFTKSCEGTNAFWSIAHPGGVLDQAELAPQGVRMLLVMVLPPYQIMMARKEITGADSFRGRKLRATGGTKEIAVELLGATPVSIPAPETRDALSRGTIDGVLFPHSSALPYGLAPELQWGTQDMNFGSFVASYVISESRWQQLSPKAQQAMTDAAEDIIRSACAVAEELDLKDKQEMADAGVTFVSLPDADKEKIEADLAGIGERWAADLDARGLAGTEILTAFREALAGQTPAAE